MSDYLLSYTDNLRDGTGAAYEMLDMPEKCFDVCYEVKNTALTVVVKDTRPFYYTARWDFYYDRDADGNLMIEFGFPDWSNRKEVEHFFKNILCDEDIRHLVNEGKKIKDWYKKGRECYLAYIRAKDREERNKFSKEWDACDDAIYAICWELAKYAGERMKSYAFSTIADAVLSVYDLGRDRLVDSDKITYKE